MAVQLQARLHISLCTYRCKPVTCVRTLQGAAVLCRNVSDRSYSTERGLGVMVAGRGPARVIGVRSASLPSFKGEYLTKLAIACITLISAVLYTVQMWNFWGHVILWAACMECYGYESSAELALGYREV